MHVIVQNVVRKLHSLKRVYYNWEVELEETSKDEVVKHPISDPFSINTPRDISDDDLPF